VLCHTGKKALSTEASYQLAEHATETADPAEIRVLRLIAEGNAQSDCAQLLISEETVRAKSETSSPN